MPFSSQTRSPIDVTQHRPALYVFLPRVQSLPNPARRHGLGQRDPFSTRNTPKKFCNKAEFDTKRRRAQAVRAPIPPLRLPKTRRFVPALERSLS